MLYLQTVTPALLNIIQTVSKEPFFQSFRLVGGTALSLHFGHRMSIDADFFSNEPFEFDEATQTLSRLLPGFLVVKKSTHGFAGMYQGVKIDMYTWGVPFLLPPIEEENIRLTALPDLAGLKLEALTNRKEEKDYRDAYALLQHFSMAELVSFFHERYPHISQRILTDHLLAAPFVERDLSIKLFDEIPWEQLCDHIVEKVRLYYDEILKAREAMEAERLQNRLEEIKKRKR